MLGVEIYRNLNHTCSQVKRGASSSFLWIFKVLPQFSWGSRIACWSSCYVKMRDPISEMSFFHLANRKPGRKFRVRLIGSGIFGQLSILKDQLNRKCASRNCGLASSQASLPSLSTATLFAHKRKTLDANKFKSSILFVIGVRPQQFFWLYKPGDDTYINMFFGLNIGGNKRDAKHSLTSTSLLTALKMSCVTRHFIASLLHNFRF